jgi:hypothetical protein
MFFDGMGVATSEPGSLTDRFEPPSMRNVCSIEAHPSLVRRLLESPTVRAAGDREVIACHGDPLRSNASDAPS